MIITCMFQNNFEHDKIDFNDFKVTLKYALRSIEILQP